MKYSKGLARTVAIGLAGASLFVADAASAASYTVTMAQMRYGSLPPKLKVGDTIVWVNRDTVLHTVTARDRSFDLRIAPGNQATMVVKKAGSIPFYCTIHPMMRGTLSVSP